MDFETYKEWTRETAVYPVGKVTVHGTKIDLEEQYLIMGLANEVGEFLGADLGEEKSELILERLREDLYIIWPYQIEQLMCASKQEPSRNYGYATKSNEYQNCCCEN